MKDEEDFKKVDRDIDLFQKMYKNAKYQTVKSIVARQIYKREDNYRLNTNLQTYRTTQNVPILNEITKVGTIKTHRVNPQAFDVDIIVPPTPFEKLNIETSPFESRSKSIPRLIAPMAG